MSNKLILLPLLFFLCNSVEASKIGFVDTRRILRESLLSRDANKRLANEFSVRFQKVKTLEAHLEVLQGQMDNSSARMTYAERHELERHYNELSSELHMAQHESSEAFNNRRSQEYQRIIRLANELVQRIATREHFDAILQEAVYVSKNVDITDRVIIELNATEKTKNSQARTGS